MPGASPRFFLPVGGSKAYVTELYSNVIWVIDYRAGTVLRSIQVDGKTEQLIPWGGKIYINESTRPYLGSGTIPTTVHAILVVDPVSDQVIHTLPLPADPASMALVQNDLYVLSARQDSPAVSASLYKVDLTLTSITGHATFGPTRTPALLRYSLLADQFLFSDSGGIYVMHPTDALPTVPFITSNNWNVYGLNTDPTNGDIYISDAVDYQQASKIMRYSLYGSSLDRFSAGIITNGFVFK
jgi:DNA-binding beta-propeller fold protein YncE